MAIPAHIIWTMLSPLIVFLDTSFFILSVSDSCQTRKCSFRRWDGGKERWKDELSEDLLDEISKDCSELFHQKSWNYSSFKRNQWQLSSAWCRFEPTLKYLDETFWMQLIYILYWQPAQLNLWFKNFKVVWIVIISFKDCHPVTVTWWEGAPWIKIILKSLCDWFYRPGRGKIWEEAQGWRREEHPLASKGWQCLCCFGWRTIWPPGVKGKCFKMNYPTSIFLMANDQLPSRLWTWVTFSPVQNDQQVAPSSVELFLNLKTRQERLSSVWLGLNLQTSARSFFLRVPSRKCQA